MDSVHKRRVLRLVVFLSFFSIITLGSYACYARVQFIKYQKHAEDAYEKKYSAVQECLKSGIKDCLQAEPWNDMFERGIKKAEYFNEIYIFSRNLSFILFLAIWIMYPASIWIWTGSISGGTKCLLFGTMFLFTCTIAKAQTHIHPERWYQSRWCQARGLEMEVVMPDGTRADCVNATHAIEFDFGKKWAESIGQALDYGAQSGKIPGVVLVLERAKDVRYLNRVKKVRDTYRLPLEVWAVDEEGEDAY